MIGSNFFLPASTTVPGGKVVDLVMAANPSASSVRTSACSCPFWTVFIVKSIYSGTNFDSSVV